MGRRRSERENDVGLGARGLVIVVGVLMLAAACSSETSTPSASPPKTGSGGQEESLPAGESFVKAASMFTLEGLGTGVLEGMGSFAFHWVAGLIEGDKTEEELQEISKGVEQLKQSVEQLTVDVESMRASMDQAFKDQAGLIQDSSLQGDRKTIDDARLNLQRFTEDTQSALASGSTLPKVNDYLGEYANPRNASELYNLVYQDLDTALRGGGSNVGGPPLIGTADAIFAGQQAQAEAAKTAAPFDDRPLWLRLGLDRTATQADVEAACTELRASQPASSVCATNGAGGATPTVSYYDRMQTFIDYYVSYQVYGLLVLLTALYAWDDGGACPVPAQGECAVAAVRAQELTFKVINNVRAQVAMAGAPVSSTDAVLELGSGDTATLWSTGTTNATFTQTPPSVPPNGWPEWRVPIDCGFGAEPRATDRPDEGMPCETRDNPYVVGVPSSAPEDQICVGAPTIGTKVASNAGGANGVFDALPSEWASCARPDATAPPTGQRVPTRHEIQTALGKNPENWIKGLGDASTGTALGTGPYLSYTPAQVVCGVAVGDDQVDHFWSGSYTMSPINVSPDRWINGRAETWSKQTAWSPTSQHRWVEPQVFTFNSSGSQEAAAQGYGNNLQCDRVYGDMGQDGWAEHLITRGFVQCVKNPSLYRDWCYGHRNYHGVDLPAADQQLRVWAARSLVICPGQLPKSSDGKRDPAAGIDGCEPDSRPTGKDWEIPACKTPAGVWTRCGTAWLDAVLPKPKDPPTVVSLIPEDSTTTTSTVAPTTTVAPSTTTAPVTTAPPTTTAPVSSTTSTTSAVNPYRRP